MEEKLYAYYEFSVTGPQAQIEAFLHDLSVSHGRKTQKTYSFAPGESCMFSSLQSFVEPITLSDIRKAARVHSQVNVQADGMDILPDDLGKGKDD